MRKTAMTMRFDDELKALVEDLAKSERRSMTNMFECLIGEALTARGIPLPAAENPVGS